MVIHLTLLTATIGLAHVSAFEQVDQGKSRHGSRTIARAIDRHEILLGVAQLILILIYQRCAHSDDRLRCGTCIVVTTEDTHLDAGVARSIVDACQAHVTGASLLLTESTAVDGVDLSGRVLGHVDIGFQGVALSEGATVHIVHLSAIEVDVCLVGTAVCTSSEDVGRCIVHAVVDVDHGLLHIISHAIVSGHCLHTMCATKHALHITRVEVYAGVVDRREVTTAIDTIGHKGITLGVFRSVKEHVGLVHAHIAWLVAIATSTTHDTTDNLRRGVDGQGIASRATDDVAWAQRER